MATVRNSLFLTPFGQSMLHELGARPWQNPPQYTTLEETVDFYISKMSTDEVANQVIDVLGWVFCTDLAHVIQPMSWKAYTPLILVFLNASVD